MKGKGLPGRGKTNGGWSSEGPIAGQGAWGLANDQVELEVSTHGGNLWPVRFTLGERVLEPLHRAPWLDEPGAAEIPMLQGLRGDFFCAPFGANDVDPAEDRDHGLTANGRWEPVDAAGDRLELRLDGRVSGADVSKQVRLQPGQPVVYQEHRLVGGSGRLPLGHHAMLRAPDDESLELSFAPFVWAGTPPEPVEVDPRLGRSLLRYPQRFSSLEAVERADGSVVDLRSYPSMESSEEIVMLVTDPDEPLGWSAAVAPQSGWIFFAVRPNTVLRSTLLWLSNGGRDYPPFLGRHQRVLGIEEVTSYFHRGHRASTESNELERAGFPTSVELGGTLTTRYAFGCIPAPEGFGRVASLRPGEDQLLLSDRFGREVTVPFDVSFLSER